MASNRTIWRERLIIVATCVVALVCVPVFLRFDRTHAGWSADASNDLAELSTSARNDVDASYQQFHESLTAQDRDEMQQIHGLVSESSDHADLLLTFDNWFQQLSPFQREQVGEADSLEKQITVIQTLLANQNAQRDVVEVPLDEDLLLFSAAGRSRSELDQVKEHVRNLQDDLAPMQQFNVTTTEFDSMIETVLDALPETAQGAFANSLDQRKGDLPPDVRRRVRVRALLAATRALGPDYWHNRREMLIRIAPAVIEQLQDSELRQTLKTLEPDQQATIVGAIVMRSVQHNLDLSPYFPDEAELKRFLKDVDRETQIKLLAMKPERAKFRASLMYVVKTGPDDIKENVKQMLAFVERRQTRRQRPGQNDNQRPPRPQRPPTGPGKRR